jgi:hypothetical protein
MEARMWLGRAQPDSECGRRNCAREGVMTEVVDLGRSNSLIDLAERA